MNLGGEDFFKMQSPGPFLRPMELTPRAAFGWPHSERLPQMSQVPPVGKASAWRYCPKFCALPLLTLPVRSGGGRSPHRSPRFQSQMDLNPILSLSFCVYCQPAMGTWASPYTSLSHGSAFTTQRLLEIERTMHSA